MQEPLGEVRHLRGRYKLAKEIDKCNLRGRRKPEDRILQKGGESVNVVSVAWSLIIINHAKYL